MKPVQVCEALSFNDILLIPQYSDIQSRLDVDLETRLTNSYNIKHPICSTNMSTVTEFDMMYTMCSTGSAGFLHRFMEPEFIEGTIDRCHGIGIEPIVISVGVKQEDINLIDFLASSNILPDIILVDVAHGDNIYVHKMIELIRDEFGDKIDIIAGNIATDDAAVRMADLGVNAIRVGIGGSKVCTTRQVTGHGIPTLQSIIWCKQALLKGGYDIPIIADGGFNNSGDIVKALAFGAESVSLGTLLAPTSDSPGPTFVVGCATKKKCYGMASKEAVEIHREGIKPGTTPEGKTLILDYMGDTKEVVEGLLGGIRSGLTYSGVRNIKELQDKSEYIVLRNGGIIESKL